MNIGKTPLSMRLAIRRYQIKRRTEREAAGLCVQCGKNPVEEYKTCYECRSIRAAPPITFEFDFDEPPPVPPVEWERRTPADRVRSKWDPVQRKLVPSL